MNKKTKPFQNLAILACSGIIASSQAAVITWQPSVDLDAGGDSNAFISQNGTFVVGFNGGAPNTAGDGPAPITTNIGDSVFTSAGFAAFAGGGVTAGGVTVNGGWTNGFSAYADGEVFNGAATDVSNLLIGAVYNPATNVDGLATFTMTGLTAGNTYEMQIIVNDARGGGGGGIRDTNWHVGFNDGAGGTTITGVADLVNRPVDQNVGTELAGDYIIGTFVADSTTQIFDFGATRSGSALGDTLANPNNGQAQFNAFQLRETAVVPEPSSALLLGLAGVGFLVRRRK
ncbi:PEP-CTERM sorting domain-containing protein [Akkermansiaceae bacterium]|nr:PEP-CTERM sorting domain-containing protein [Akkermansiaceae bacterium]